MTDTKLSEALKALSPDDWPDEVFVGKAVLRFPNGIESGNWQSQEDAKHIRYTRAQPQPDPSAYAAGERDMQEKIAKTHQDKLDEYVRECGMYDSTTGVTEFPGNGEEWVAEKEEEIEAIRDIPIDPNHTAALDRIRAEGRAEAQGEIDRLRAISDAADRLVNNPYWGTVSYTDGEMWRDGETLRAALSQPTNTEERT